MSIFVIGSSGTTEWFGDLRAHLNPPQSPPFYDIIYDETDCPFGLESIAIPEFVYFGEMIATKSVKGHSECLQFCIETAKCKAVNYFESMSKRDRGFCELLVETQYDNPRLIRPFQKARYYEKIKCRISSDDEEQPFNFDNNGKDGKRLVLGGSNGDGIKSEESHRTNEHEQNKDEKKQREKVDDNKTTISIIEATNIGERETALKKIAQKVKEFNLRYKI